MAAVRERALGHSFHRDTAGPAQRDPVADLGLEPRSGRPVIGGVSIPYVVAGVLVVGLLAYLLYAMFKPEKF